MSTVFVSSSVFFLKKFISLFTFLLFLNSLKLTGITKHTTWSSLQWTLQWTCNAILIVYNTSNNLKIHMLKF